MWFKSSFQIGDLHLSVGILYHVCPSLWTWIHICLYNKALSPWWDLSWQQWTKGEELWVRANKLAGDKLAKRHCSSHYIHYSTVTWLTWSEHTWNGFTCYTWKWDDANAGWSRGYEMFPCTVQTNCTTLWNANGIHLLIKKNVSTVSQRLITANV